MRKTRASWKIRSNPSASSRFMAYSGLEWSQSGRSVRPARLGDEGGLEGPDVRLHPGRRHQARGLHLVEADATDRWARTAPWRRERARAISIREIVTGRA